MNNNLRLVLSLIFGLVAWYAVAIATDFLGTVGLGLEHGLRYTILGLGQFFGGGAVVLLAMKFARIDPVGAGFTLDKARSDLLVGLSVALIFGALQFFLIIPATGGAERSDIIVNSAQLGKEWSDLVGFMGLALFGSSGEEFLFRGLLLCGTALLLRDGMAGRIAATVIVIVLFALSHGYQGWAGVIDTGLYGGLTLSLLYWWRGKRLVAPIVAHIGWNVIAAFGIFFLY
ncbi:CPBP family intramembrane glutamic endopeptidase [Qipengyuania sphaerica]|uniref:CPBP family intramembrane glutamic endopeptidase n=1 Tax=Qipengyuania sphaerica TaxID=2867243 RepID=UPI001C88A024|nr:CPBP family intramembrane glutamic endopeptidase [Qipengyuania sphaerica]MBX7540516.1 CPBP family intramembrane metalloprotease [Qipengyuania sphaerica]